MDPKVIAQIFAQLRNYSRELNEVRAQYAAVVKAQESRPMSIQDQVNTIPGRRIPYMLNGSQSFTSAQNGLRGDAINCLVSQDGPFIMTHYPLVAWRPNAPSSATNFGRWRPVASWPLPTQELSSDFIDISFEIVDGGTQRNYQNSANGPGPLSRPDNIVPLPEWSVVSPNSVLQFFPTYEAINFNSDGTATTGGLLEVQFLGFRIVNS